MAFDANDMWGRLSPSARKKIIGEEGSDQVVRNQYEKAVATGNYTGTLEEFATQRGMRVRNRNGR